MKFVYSLILVISTIIELTTSNEIQVDNNIPSLEKDKQSRLISFNNEHGEIKVELDFAVPFLKIPMETKRSGGHHTLHDPLLEINTKGLVTVVSMLFLFITIIPKIVKLFIPQAHDSERYCNGIGLSGVQMIIGIDIINVVNDLVIIGDSLQDISSTIDGLVPLMSKIDDALRSIDVPSNECYQRSACWFGSSKFIGSSYHNNSSTVEWLKNIVNRPDINEAMKKGENGEDCSIYKCNLPMRAIANLFTLGRNILGNEN